MNNETHLEHIVVLDVKNLHVKYSEKEIIRGASFQLYRGEIVAIFGENGAGKSTMLKTIAGIIRSSNGEIQLGGKSITNEAALERQRKGIGCLLQRENVFLNLTSSENIALATNRLALEGSPKIGDIFSLLSSKGRKRASQLSGGERQMLAIEMLFAQKPRIFLLDEPTAAIAVDQRPYFLNYLLHQIKAGCSALLVDQDAQWAKSFCNRWFVVREGTICSHDHD